MLVTPQTSSATLKHHNPFRNLKKKKKMEMSTKVPSKIYTFKWPVARKHVHKCLCISSCGTIIIITSWPSVVGIIACVAIGRTTMVILNLRKRPPYIRMEP